MEVVLGIVVGVGASAVVRSSRSAGMEGSGEGFGDDSESERRERRGELGKARGKEKVSSERTARIRPRWRRGPVKEGRER